MTKQTGLLARAAAIAALKESNAQIERLVDRVLPTYGHSREDFAAGVRGNQIAPASESRHSREAFAAGVRGEQINEELKR